MRGWVSGSNQEGPCRSGDAIVIVADDKDSWKFPPKKPNPINAIRITTFLFFFTSCKYKHINVYPF